MSIRNPEEFLVDSKPVHPPVIIAAGKITANAGMEGDLLPQHCDPCGDIGCAAAEVDLAVSYMRRAVRFWQVGDF